MSPAFCCLLFVLLRSECCGDNGYTDFGSSVKGGFEGLVMKLLVL